MRACWDNENGYGTRIMKKKFGPGFKEKKEEKQRKETPSQGASENERRQPINTLAKIQNSCFLQSGPEVGYIV